MEENIKNYINILADEYLKAFYAFAVSRTNNAYEAEELAQEITYQCIIALNKLSEINKINNLNAFLWGIAHNTYKRYCYKKKNNKLISKDDNESFMNNIIDVSPHSNIEEFLLKSENMRQIRKELSLMTNFYRKTLVCYYYDSLTIAETGKKLGLSIEMVKFYLQKGRKKLKEAYIMSKEYGEKSFNPAPFTVFRGTLDFCSVNVWKIFERKLPGQIALICYDSPKTIDEICLETGTPAAYIEDELQILVESELLICPVKDKYRTNFFILRQNALKQLKDQFIKMYSEYVPTVVKTYEKYLPEMKKCDIFKFDAKDSRYAWVFDSIVTNFAGANLDIGVGDYMTLADGVKGFVYAQEELYFKNYQNHSGVYSEKDNITIHASSPNQNNYPRLERELVGEGVVNKNFTRISALYDIYKGDIKDSDKEIYAWLIEHGYVFRENGKLICDVAVHTEKSKQLFKKINGELNPVLTPLCKEIYENISRIVAATIPPQLKEYIHGYTSFEIQHYAQAYFKEVLYEKGFLTIPENSDKTPVSCWIDEM